MKTMIVEALDDHRGDLIAQALWGPIHHNPPNTTPDLLVVALDIGDLVLAFCVARHWGCMLQRRQSSTALVSKLNGTDLPEELESVLRNRQAVIVTRQLTSANLEMITRVATKLGRFSGKNIIVGTIKNGIEKHDGLDVRTTAEV